MNNAVAGLFESKHAWEDVESWSLTTLVSLSRRGVTVEMGSQSHYLAFSEPTVIRAARVPVTVAYSEARHLLAARAEGGPVAPLKPDHGVFGLLGRAERYVFLKVIPAEPPQAASACWRCRFPAGAGEDEVCESHLALGAGSVYRGGRFNKLEREAAAAAFDGSARRLATAIDKVAREAFPLEAMRLLAKYMPSLRSLGGEEERAVVALALQRLVEAAGDISLGLDLDATLDAAATTVGLALFDEAPVTLTVV